MLTLLKRVRNKIQGTFSRDEGSQPQRPTPVRDILGKTRDFFSNAYQNRPIAPQNYQGSNLQRNMRGMAAGVKAANQSPLLGPARMLFGDGVTGTNRPEEQNPGLLRNNLTRPLPQTALTISDILGGPDEMKTGRMAPFLGTKPLTSYASGKDESLLPTTLQSIARSGAGLTDTLGKQLGMGTPDQTAVNDMFENPTEQKIANAIFGKDQTIRTMGASKNFLEDEYNMPGLLAGSLAVAGPMIDVLPGGGGKGQAAKKAASKADDAARLAQQVGPKVDDILKRGKQPIQNVLQNVDDAVSVVQDRAKNSELFTALNKARTGAGKELRSIRAAIKENKYPELLDDLLENEKALRKKYAQAATEVENFKGARAGGAGAEEIIKNADDIPIHAAKEAKPVSSMLEPIRGFRDMFGGEASKVYRAIKATVLNPFEAAKGGSANWKKSYHDSVKESVPFGAGSKESAAIQEFGEGKKTYEQLVEQFGNKKADQIVESDSFFREAYDNILQFVNEKRVAQGLDEITPRADYYRHLRDRTGGWLQELISPGQQGAGVTSESIARERLGDKTTMDAVGGFAEYLEKAGRMGFTDEHGRTFKTLADNMANNGANPQVVNYLKQHGADVLGEQDAKSMGFILDTAANIANSVGKLVRTNKIVGNLSSLAMQGANVPHAFMKSLTSDRNGYKYVTQGLVNMKKNSKAMEQSPFLADRGYHVPAQFISGIKNKALNAGGRALQQADMAATRYIWSTFYEQALGKNISNPIQYADDMAKQMVGGRGLGDVAPVLRTRFGSTVFPFSVEWANSFHVMTDMAKEKSVGGTAALLGTFAAYNAYNSAFEGGFGFRPLADPYAAVGRATEYAVGTDKKEQSYTKAVGTIAGELATANPYVQNVLAIAYPVAEMAGAPKARDIFGSDDPSRFGSVSMYSPFEINRNSDKPEIGLKPPTQLAADYTPTRFGNQAKKTIEGILAGNRGYTTSSRGTIHHEVPTDPLNRIRMAAAGQWSTPASKEHFDDDFSRPMYSSQKDVFDALPEKDRLDFLRNSKEQNRERAKSQSPTNQGQGFFDRMFNKQPDFNFDTKPTTQDGRKQYKTMLDTAIQAGIAPPQEAIREGYFNEGLATGNTVKERNSAFKQLHSLMSDEFVTDEQKEAFLKASGATHDQYDYYRIASMDRMSILEEEILPNISDPSSDEGLRELAKLRARVGGKEILNNTMIDYLYEQDYISKQQVKFLKAIQFDQINEEFYIKKNYKGGGGSGGRGGRGGRGTKGTATKNTPFGDITYNQAIKLFDFGFKPPKMRPMDMQSLYNIPGMTNDPKLIDTILRGPSV